METKYRSFTNILYIKPNYLKGVARLANVLGNSKTKYNSSRSAMEADSKALKSDWATVGNDLRKSIDGTK
ncbi:hypothetical protein ABGF48_00810 [Helcococcus bovis]|uniref:hypothetical protein n=1 Tax=Helcococcus bovis TaxID=3153252 RepID=UPI0038BB3BB3